MDESRKALDLPQVRRVFERAAPLCTQAAVVSQEVERRMAEKLAYIKFDPARVLDAGAGVGFGLSLLRARYPRAEFVGLDIAHAMLREARAARSFLDRIRSLAAGRAQHWVCGDFSHLPLAGASMNMVWSNLSLSWAAEPLQTLREFGRVLATEGVLLFSSYGPDSLKELRSAFGASDARPHVHEFVDMHDLGDMLIAAGFDAPVMEMEKIEITYPDVATLARDLKLSGQTCAATNRRHGLTTPRAWRRMLSEYEKWRRQGRLPVTVEVVYGHAWKGEPRVAADGRQVVRMDRAVGRSR